MTENSGYEGPPARQGTPWWIWMLGGCGGCLLVVVVLVVVGGFLSDGRHSSLRWITVTPSSWLNWLSIVWTD